MTCPSQHVWLAKLLDFDYEIEFKKGKDNIAADPLSRVTCAELSTLTVSTIATTIMDEIKAIWEGDQAVQTLIQELIRDPNSYPHYSWVNHLLCRKGKIIVGCNVTLQTQLIALYHDLAVGGHFGATVTANKVANGYYWKGQQKHVRQYVRDCPI